MSTEHENLRPENGRQAPERADETEKISSERRRAILRGLSKGAAIAGAAVPLQSLATSGQKMKLKKGGQDYVCSVSGQMSVLMSAGASSVPACSGRSLDYWQIQNNWPSGQVGGTGPLVRGCYFGTLFRACSATFGECFDDTTSSYKGKGIFDIVKGTVADPTSPNSPEAQWVMAVLNAGLASNANYPYSSHEVVQQYKQGGNTRVNALSLHNLIRTPT